MSKVSLSPHALAKAAACLRALSHPARLRIIELLSIHDLSVGEIARECEIAHNLASTHLKLLERCGFLASTRSGRMVTYRVTEKHLLELLRCMQKRFGKDR